MAKIQLSEETIEELKSKPKKIEIDPKISIAAEEAARQMKLKDKRKIEVDFKLKPKPIPDPKGPVIRR